MIRVHIELESARGPHRDRTLGWVIIRNDGTSHSLSRGNYTVEARRPGGRRERVTAVRNFPRQSRSALELLRRALNALHEGGNLP
jgi:hypothetical protein